MVPEVELVHLAPFTGFQMFLGKPEPHAISFMQVKGIEKMHDYIISKGWDKITEIITQPWGGKTCSLTTIDGYIINIFEWYKFQVLQEIRIKKIGIDSPL